MTQISQQATSLTATQAQLVWHGSQVLKMRKASLESREETWSCTAMFEAGTNLNPQGLQHVIAMAWENSIFVTNVLLSDPSDTNSAHSIKRIIGNVGRAGLTMMVAPDKPQILAPSNCFSLVNHHAYPSPSGKLATFSAPRIPVIVFMGY